MMAPMRLGNLARIDLQRHLSWTRDGRKGIVHLAIPGQETKTGEPLEFELPKDTVRLLEIYLQDFRPRLCDPTSPWLFPGRNGKHKAVVSLSGQIKRTLRDELGIEMNAHLFRHFGAMLYLRANPGGYEVVRQVLGHRSVKTTVMAYTGMEGAAASKHFDATILKLREAPMLDIRRRS
jgi:integrase